MISELIIFSAFEFLTNHAKDTIVMKNAMVGKKTEEACK